MSLWERLDSFPRVALGAFPTPLEPLPRLSQALRRPVLLKRDDLPGPAFGGNKARKLEYLMAEAQAQRASQIVTFGGLQSNHARMTAAAARQLGMSPHLFYFAARPRRMTGNLLLCERLGARMYFLPLPESGEPGLTLAAANRLVRVVARLVVGPHCFIPVGGHSWRGALGYVRAALELHEQLAALGYAEGHVVVAAGTGGTLAGLMAGLALCGAGLRPLGIDVGRLWKGFPVSIASLAAELCGRLGERRVFRPSDVPLIEGRYVGAGYSVPTAEAEAAARRLALLEGVVLDPIYTAKAFAGMLDLVERGKLGRATPLVFVHTGGAPGVFA